MRAAASTLRTAISLALCGAVAGAAVGLAVFRGAGTELRAAAEDKYRALFEVRRAALLDYLVSVREETRFWNKNRVMREALLDFRAAWAELPEAQATLQRLYIDENPHPLGEKDNLEAAA